MQPAALGLTNSDALSVFSQYETLRLQRRVAELEARLKTVVHSWRAKYTRKVEQLVWARDVMWGAGIETGCRYGTCDYCEEFAGELGVCRCLVQTCQCRQCEEDREMYGIIRSVPGALDPFDSEMPPPSSPTFEEARESVERETSVWPEWGDETP